MRVSAVASGFAVLALLAAPAQAAGPSAAAMDYAYKVYFKAHPPKDKPVKYNLYPYAGPVIPSGADIPLCAAARDTEAYARKTAVKYIKHGKDGWLFRTADFRTDFTASPQALAYFNRLNRALEAKGQTLIIAFQPPRAMLAAAHIDPADQPTDYSPARARKGYEAFLQQLKDQGLTVADLSETDKKIEYFAKGDFHWTPAGAADSAFKLAAALKDTRAYSDMKKQDFESGITGLDVATRGAFEEFIQQTCKINIELTAKPLWATHATGDGAVDAASLLGDEAFPAVTVVGTSNAAEDDKFNFVGALKRFTRTDIYNAALTGGGFGASAYRYYASEEYHEHPPTVVIWEFLPQHNYNNAESLNAFRQMIPAVHGACTKDKALAEYTGAITGPQTAFFDKIADTSLKDTYLYLEVKNPAARDLRIDILYRNGNADQVDLTRTTRIGNNGKYYLELGDSGNDHALYVHLVTDKPEGNMTARLCPYGVQVAGR